MTIFSNDALIGEHILITGATGGIGYEAAKEAVRTGAHITITGRNEEKLESLKEECNKLNSEVEVFVGPADINSEDDRKQLVQNAKESIGPITGLVNSAGIGEEPARRSYRRSAAKTYGIKLFLYCPAYSGSL